MSAALLSLSQTVAKQGVRTKRRAVYPSHDVLTRLGMRSPPRDCPCHSGLRYGACCGPFHEGAEAAATPEALMRSRYAAFSLGLGAYLVRTLHSSHADL